MPFTISARLDRVASILEDAGLKNIAASLDAVSNTLDSGGTQTLIQQGLDAIKKDRSFLGNQSKRNKILKGMLSDPHAVALAEHWVKAHQAEAAELAKQLNIEGDISEGLTRCASALPGGIKRGVLLAVLLAMGAAHAGGNDHFSGGTASLDTLEKNLIEFTQGASGHELFKTMTALRSSDQGHKKDGDILRVLRKHMPENLVQRMVITFDLKEGYSSSYEEAGPEGAGKLLTKEYPPGQTTVVESFDSEEGAFEYYVQRLQGPFEQGLREKGLHLKIVKSPSGGGYDLVATPRK